jgi:hypothetical protein
MRTTGLLGVLLAITALSAIAGDDNDDPPSRVARLNFQNGAVSFRPGSIEEWTAATINYPLTSGDHLWTDAGATAEIHVGSTAIRMAPQTALSILNLDDRIVQLSVTQGSVDVRLRSLADDEAFEVDTPNVAATLLRPGDYRIDADGDNNLTTVTVRGGDAEVTGAGAAFTIHARESARLSGLDQVSQEVGPAPPPNEFDNWCMARDRREQQAQTSARYVPRDMVGYEDLDEYGVWREDQQYGWVWAPRTVAVGWAPYHNGRWAWIEPWGWTWVDEAPWGFAPFHYGRWAFTAGGWVWVPGRLVAGVRPVYAPALVAFVGGAGFGIGVGVGGGGAAAWFPLGPGEVYRPAYRVSEFYVRQVNITHVSNINVVNVTNVRYVNQNVVGAVTVVPHEAFVSARPVAQVSVRVDARVVAQAQVVGTTALVAPRRESIMVHTGPPIAAPPARFVERSVVARSAPAAPPVSFAAKQQALQANPGRPLAPEQTRTLRVNTPAPRPMVRTVTAAPGRVAPQGQPVMTPRPQPAAEPATPSIQRNDRPAPSPQREIRELPKEQPATARPAAEARHEATPEPKDGKKKASKKADKKDEKKQ